MYVVITESRNLHIWGTNIDIISKIPTEDYDIIRSYLKSIGYKEFRNYIYDAVLKECSSREFYPKSLLTLDEIGRKYADNTYGALAQMFEKLFCSDDVNQHYYNEHFKNDIIRDLLFCLFKECYYTIDGNEKPLNNFNYLFSDDRMHGKIQKDFYQYLSENDIWILWEEFAQEWIDTEKNPAFKNGNIPKAVNSSLEYIQYYIEKLWKSRDLVLVEDPEDFSQMSFEDIEKTFIDLCENCKFGYFNINDFNLTKTDLGSLYEYLISINEHELFQGLERHDEAIQKIVVDMIEGFDLDNHMSTFDTITEKYSVQLHESIVTLIEDIRELLGKTSE